MKHRPLPERVAPPHDGQPAGVSLAAAFGTMYLFVTASLIIGLSTSWAVALVALLVGIFSRGSGWPASLGVALIGWLFVTGFVINRLGELDLSGPGDAWRLLLLVEVAVLATAVSRRRRGVAESPGVIRVAGPSPAADLAEPQRPIRSAARAACLPDPAPTDGRVSRAS